ARGRLPCGTPGASARRRSTPSARRACSPHRRWCSAWPSHIGLFAKCETWSQPASLQIPG
ncbi:unnamed protein product, partial [Effrenium voratum]